MISAQERFRRTMAAWRFPPAGRSGVYVIANVATGEMYVGSSRDIRRRWKGHLKDLKAGTASRRLQAAWNSFGADVFRFAVVASTSDDRVEMERIEQEHIDRLDAAGCGGYNARPRAQNNTGFRFTPEMRARRSEQLLAQWAAGVRERKPVLRTPADEARRIQRIKELAAAGRFHPNQRPSPEHRRAISEKMRGNAHTKGRVAPADERVRRSDAAKAWWRRRRGES